MVILFLTIVAAISAIIPVMAATRNDISKKYVEFFSDEEKEALMTQYIAEIKVDFKTKEARLHTTELYKRIEKYD